jgi:putative RecB family exonuclease
MLDVALAEWPDDYTVKSVAEAFSVDVPGLSKPLVGEFDLVTVDGGDETICDWKTASMKWPNGKAGRDLQATVFTYAYQKMYGVNPLFRFDVFTKAKNPAHHQFYTLRSHDDFERLVFLAGKIEKAVNTGVFLPVESCMNCSECSYSNRCKAVHRKAA